MQVPCIYSILPGCSPVASWGFVLKERQTEGRQEGKMKKLKCKLSGPHNFKKREKIKKKKEKEIRIAWLCFLSCYLSYFRIKSR